MIYTSTGEFIVTLPRPKPNGRRLQRLREMSRWRWLVTNEGPNRHERRKYLAQLRIAHRAEARNVVHPDL